MQVKRVFKSELGVKTVALIFDRYDVQNSLKASERQRRGQLKNITHSITGNRDVPHYRNFMKCTQNKAALAAFVSNYLMEIFGDYVSQDQELILAGGFTTGSLTKLVKSECIMELDALSSTHEEADTRMLLHATNMSAKHERIVVRSDDTDVMVLLIYYTSKGKLGSSVYMHAGHEAQTVNHRRFIPVHTIAEIHGERFCESLPAVHALTGCDATSSFYRIGKRLAYSKLQEFVKRNDDVSLGKFGLGADLDNDILLARSYVLTLYGKKNHWVHIVRQIEIHLSIFIRQACISVTPY